MTPQLLSTTASVLAALRQELGRRTGLRLDAVSDRMLERTLNQMTAQTGVESLVTLVDDLCTSTSTDHVILQQLVRELTIGETSFFRHADDIEFLRSEVFPDLVRGRQAERRLHIWSAGCSTGEEVYTLAALLLEHIPQPETWDLSILGTDMNTRALETASVAEYGKWSFRGVSTADQTRWFERLGPERWRPIEAVRRFVTVDYLNLRDPIYPAIFTRTTEVDLILCRNVFIYFFPEVVQFVLGRMAACLQPDGWILCGPSDLMLADVPTLLQRVPGQNALRLRRPGLEEPAYAPSTPQLDPAPLLDNFLARAHPPTPPATRQTSRPRPARSATPSASNAELESLLRAGAYEEAITAARDRLDNESLSVELSRLLALALSATSDPAAVDAWKRVLYLAPTDPAAHLGLGFVLLKNQREQDARREFQTVVRLLKDVDDAQQLPGPDALPVGWVRNACESLGRARTERSRD